MEGCPVPFAPVFISTGHTRSRRGGLEGVPNAGGNGPAVQVVPEVVGHRVAGTIAVVALVDLIRQIRRVDGDRELVSQLIAELELHCLLGPIVDAERVREQGRLVVVEEVRAPLVGEPRAEALLFIGKDGAHRVVGDGEERGLLVTGHDTGVIGDRNHLLGMQVRVAGCDADAIEPGGEVPREVRAADLHTLQHAVGGIVGLGEDVFVVFMRDLTAEAHHEPVDLTPEAGDEHRGRVVEEVFERDVVVAGLGGPEVRISAARGAVADVGDVLRVGDRRIQVDEVGPPERLAVAYAKPQVGCEGVA